jgi:hypothetical protein
MQISMRKAINALVARDLEQRDCTDVFAPAGTRLLTDKHQTLLGMLFSSLHRFTRPMDMPNPKRGPALEGKHLREFAAAAHQPLSSTAAAPNNAASHVLPLLLDA